MHLIIREPDIINIYIHQRDVGICRRLSARSECRSSRPRQRETGNGSFFSVGGRGFPRLKSVESGKRNKDGKAWWNVRLGDGREKRLQMVINKIASATHGSLTSLVRSASPNGPWRVLWVQSASCLSSQSSLSVWWVHSFSSHRWEALWSPTDFGTRHDIKQEPLTPRQKKNRHLKGAETDSLTSDFLLIWSVSGTQNNG